MTNRTQLIILLALILNFQFFTTIRQNEINERLKRIELEYINKEIERWNAHDREMKKINNWYDNHPNVNRF